MHPSDSQEPGDLKIEKLIYEVYFPTLIYFLDCPGLSELNLKFLSIIRAEREKDRKGLVRSNLRQLSGWHSRENLHKIPVFEQLTNRIYRVAAEISKQLTYHED